MSTTAEKLRALAEFDAKDSYYRLGYDDHREPHVKEIIEGARGENARLKAAILAAADLVEALEYYANPSNFISGRIDNSDMTFAIQISGRVIDNQMPTETTVSVGGRRAKEAIAKLEEVLK